ncbi:MAG TPA: potassium-transporting ATPase subunit KdpC [Steroidobacteraceae bacterium]|nr:potassium-transporting ATPase subunit KdpC [Steroidobacteraceae bacterium]
MRETIVRHIRPAVSLLLLMTILVGIVYPLVITAVAKVAFPRQAAGSLLYRDGKLVGSALIGQNFSDPRYFWGRPSATTPQPYNGVGSTGSNLGPLNPALIDQVKANAKALRDADPENRQPIPVDLVTASASGLDPEISLAAARYQAHRVAKARSLPLAQVEELIRSHRRGRLLGFVGERRVNVLELNLALDRLR